MSEQKSKVLLLGWDAADWKIITPLMEQGLMPNLSRFVEKGVMGNLSTIYPVLSPMLWTSIATGKRAWKHGIHGFTEPDPQTGGVRPVTNLGRKTKAIWNMLNQQGYRSNIVGWWPSHPAEPINGTMVSNQLQVAVASPDKPWPIKPGTVFPADYTKKIAEFRVHPSEITAEEILPFVPLAEKIDQDKDKRLFNVAKILAECATIHGVSTALMELEEWDFTAIYHDAIDHLCHGFMRYHPPKLPWVADEDFEIFKDVINAGYQFHDLMLGRIMQLAGDETTIIICSDHGFHADHLRPKELPNEPAGPAEEHRHYGIFAAMGPGIRQDELVYGASLLDITPTILNALGLPVGRDMDGKVLTSIFEEARELNYIDSWDELEGESGEHPEDLQMDPVDQHEALQQLVDLGYIEDVGKDQSQAAENASKELKYNLARDLIGSGKHPEAIEILEQLWENHPEESRFGIQQFDCYLTIRHFDKAIQVLDNLKQRKSDYALKANEELEKLKETFKDKPFEDLGEKTQRELKKLHKKSLTNVHTFSFLEGRLLLDQQQYEAALKKFALAASVQAHNQPSLMHKMGEAYLGLKDWELAEKVFSKILKIDPVNAMASFGLARAYYGQKNADQSLSWVQTSLGLFFHYPNAHYLCGVLLQEKGFMLEATKALETAISQNPVMPHAYRRLSLIYRRFHKDPAKSRYYLDLALSARLKIREFRAGKLESKQLDVDEVDRDKLATLGDIGQSKRLEPLSDKEIVIVSGLPRSGTSMMMQMLSSGGLPVLTDEKRAADEDNPKGYYEFEDAKVRSDSQIWLTQAQGHAVKLVAQLIPVLSPEYQYRIIFMERPLSEVVRSQSKMLQRLGKKGGSLKKRVLADSYIDQIALVKNIIAKYPKQISALSVAYHDALEQPEILSKQINDFLGGELDETGMASAVDPSLRRQF